MLEENKILHDAFVAQLKETATNTYNTFYRAYEMMNDNVKESKEKYLSIVKNNEYLFASFDFYNDIFSELERSEDYLYIGQLYTLQIKATHNLYVIYRSEGNDNEMNYYLKRRDQYKENLYFYYLLSKGKEKIEMIMSTFVKDVKISAEAEDLAKIRFESYINKKK